MPDKCAVDPSRDCLGLVKAEALERKMEAMEQRNSESHQEIFQRLNAVEKENAVMDERYNTIIHKLDDLTEKVEALEAKPAKRWDSLVGYVLSALVGGIVVFFLAQAGLG